MSIYIGPVRERRDTEDNWAIANTVLQHGQIGAVIATTGVNAGLITHIKIGDGITPWNGTAAKKLKIFWHGDPIVTLAGRDLDNPGGPRTKPWNWDGNPNLMFKEIFDPYGKPTLTINMADLDPVETGDSVARANHPYTISITKSENILDSGGVRRVTRDIEANQVEILPPTAPSNFTFPTSGTFLKTFNVNRTVRGLYKIIQASAIDKNNDLILSNEENIIIRDRMGWFIAPESEGDYLLKSDADIRAKITAMKNLGNNMNKQVSDLYDNKITGRVELKPTPQLHFLYVYHPIDRGTTSFADTLTNNQIQGGSAQRDFVYTNGSVDLAYVAANFGATGGKNYRLTKFVNNFGGDMAIIIQ